MCKIRMMIILACHLNSSEVSSFSDGIDGNAFWGSLCFSHSMKSKLGVMIWLGYLIWRSYDYGRSIMWFLTKTEDGFFFPHHRTNIGGSAFVRRDASRERLPPRIDARGAGEEVRKRPHPKAFGDFPLRIHVSPQRRQKRGSGQDVSGKSFFASEWRDLGMFSRVVIYSQYLGPIIKVFW